MANTLETNLPKIERIVKGRATNFVDRKVNVIKPFEMKRYEKVWLDRVNAIIEANIRNPDFQLLDIANEMEISRTTLYREVRKLTGQSPNRYIRNIRLTKARKILEAGIYPTVKETAEEVGFRRPEYFSKLFYLEYKVLPSEFLRE